MVKYLSWYAGKEANPRVTFKTDINQQVERYKLKHPGKTPILVVDFIGTIPMLLTSPNESKYAGRHSELIRRAEAILQKFKSAGIDLTFFLDGPVKSMKFPEWCRRANEQYENHKAIYVNLKANEPITYNFDKYLKSYYENYLRAAKKYGRIFVSLQNECDLDLAEYATRVEALAVLSNDSDFLVLPGNWPVWIARTFNFESFTVSAWNKYHLRKSLDLQPWQMPILATLSGNDWFEYKHVKHIHQNAQSGSAFNELAKLIRERFQDRRDTVAQIVDMIYNHGKCEISRNEVIRLVQMSLEFYRCKNLKVTTIEKDWLCDHVKKTSAFNVYSISMMMPLHIPQPFVDVSKKDVSPYSDLVLPLMRREIGIFYINKRNDENFKYGIYLKPTEEEPFQLQEFTPIFPNFEVPPIDDILEDDEDIVSIEKRLELLAWVVSSKRKKPSVELLQKLLETDFIVPAMITNYLVQERQIIAEEADILLLGIHEAKRMDPEKSRNMTPPNLLTERGFWISFAYTNIIRHFEEAMTFCGLNRFVPYSYFDGFLFHKMYSRFFGLDFEEKKTIIEPVLQYRLYGL